MNLGIAGRTAVVTGASQGIGRAIAEELAAAGVHLALIARGAPALQALADELTGRYAARVVPLAGDVGGPGLAQLLGEVSAAMGRVDIVINSAGSTASGDLHADDEAIWKAAFDLKLMGYLSGCFPTLCGSPQSTPSGACWASERRRSRRRTRRSQGWAAPPKPPGHGTCVGS